MPHKYCIVIPNRYPEFAYRLLSSIKQHHKQTPQIFVVCDRHKTQFPDAMSAYVPGPFIFARNCNLGIKMFSECDIVLCNDDMECTEDDFFDKLAEEAYRYKKCGLLSPLIDGGVGNELQQYPPVRVWEQIKRPQIALGDRTICFPCVYLRREMIDAVGLLDESFTGYGFDDDDYCYRVRNANWQTNITRVLSIKHGSGGAKLDRGKNWSCSFAGEEKLPSNMEIFLAKYPQFRSK
ncbi:MAG TPA: hypothetical protein DGH68_02865 [Bacteroidetes bacterium]|jgi:hypothetical protein|nr:hypothetical protein [Bacteroidota bacterium]